MMKEAYWGYWLIILGIFILVIMLFTQSSTTANTQDYLQLKETTEAALYESVDYAYYRLYGELKINKEKFVENFLKRFADNVSLTNTYEISFYDLYESPPKVSVKVKSTGGTFLIAGTNNTASSTNKIDAIIEMTYDKNGDPVIDVDRHCSYLG